MYKVNKNEKPKDQSIKKTSFDDWKPLDLGRLKPGAKDWKSSEIFEEMIDEKYKDLK